MFLLVLSPFAISMRAFNSCQSTLRSFDFYSISFAFYGPFSICVPSTIFLDLGFTLSANSSLLHKVTSLDIPQ